MEPKFFATPARFRAWLEKHHAEAAELLVGFRKRDSGRASMTWSESVDEALCFGWIDGVRRRMDDASYSIRFTPRRADSRWSRINVAKVEALAKAGRMKPAGLRAFDARRPEAHDAYSYEKKERAVLPPPYAKRLRANRAAAAFHDAQPDWYRRVCAHWVISAKREETRERRLEKFIAACAARKRL